MKFIYFEIKKSWLKPITLLLVFIFTIINIYKISQIFEFSNTKQYSEELIRNSKFDLYNTIKGTVDNRKIEFIKMKSEQLTKEVDGFAFSREHDHTRYTGYVFGDYNLFNDLKNDFKYIIMYPNTTYDILEKSKENIVFYSEVGNIYEVRKNKIIYNTYSGRQLDSYYLKQGSEEYFNYDFSCLLILLLIVFFSCQSYSMEIESNMNAIITTTIRGKNIAWAKLISMLIFCILLTLYFLVLDLLTINHLYNLEGLAEPIYSLKSFSCSPYQCSVFYMFVMVSVVRCIVYVCLSSISMLISYISKKSIVSILFSFLYITVLVYIEDSNSSPINPISLLSIRDYIYTFNYTSIFGYPVNTIYIATFTTLLFCLVAVLIIVYLCRRENHVKL